MLKLNDGRIELWQWDTGRKLTVDAECSEVHFSNKVYGRSIDVAVIDGTAAIPDILLQVDKELYAWGFVGTPENGYTKISKVFRVNRRNKPEDYVFTPPDQNTLAGIMEELNKLKEVVSPEKIGEAVNEYLDENPITPEKIGAVAQNQGEENADKILGIDASGEVVPVDKPSGGKENAVTYTEQELTAEEQAQARENIGAGQKPLIVKFTGSGTDDNPYTCDRTFEEIATAYNSGRDIKMHYNVVAAAFGYNDTVAYSGIAELDSINTGMQIAIFCDESSINFENVELVINEQKGICGVSVIVPVAGYNLGVIKADPVKSTDTVPARIGEDGKLYVDALTSSTLQSAINTALAQAKESGEFDGEDGTSVTITNTTESTEDGGENVVEFSDGNKLTVWNGKTGAQGDPGVYVGSEDTMPEGTIVRIDPDGEAMELVEVDDTLKLQGYAADAKVTGEKLDELSEAIVDKVDTSTLKTAVDDALLESKNSGVFDGADGKSAYEYAQEGGYTGTEEEFAAKLAEEIPDALPNPHPLIFTGAVTGSYDGSAPLSVEIQSGGGGSSGGSGKAKSQILIDQEITELTASLSVTLEHDFHNLTAIIHCGSAGAALTADSDGTAVASRIGLLIDTTSFGFNSHKVAQTETSKETWRNMMFGAEWSDDLSVFKRGFAVEIATGVKSTYYFPFGGTLAMYGTLGTDDNAPKAGKTANIVVNSAYLNIGTRVVLWGEYYE